MNEFTVLFIILIVTGVCLLGLKNLPEMVFEKNLSRLFGWLFLSVGIVGFVSMLVVHFFIDIP